MKATSLIVAALVVIAITGDRIHGSPLPQQESDDTSFFEVDGFAFNGPIIRSNPTRRRFNTAVPIDLPITVPTVQTTVATSSPNTDQCAQNCRFKVTSEFNPVCGSDNQVYSNRGMLNCAINCGRDVTEAYVGPCATNLRG